MSAIRWSRTSRWSLTKDLRTAPGILAGCAPMIGAQHEERAYWELFERHRGAAAQTGGPAGAPAPRNELRLSARAYLGKEVLQMPAPSVRTDLELVDDVRECHSAGE